MQPDAPRLWLLCILAAPLLLPATAPRAQGFSDDFGAALRSEWRAADIGELGETEFTGAPIKTSATTQDGVLTLVSGGDNSFDRLESDSFGFLYVPATDDWTATLKVLHVGERRVRAGLMARTSLDPDAPSVFLALQRAGGLFFGMRDTAGAVPKLFRTGDPDHRTPVWLRLTRHGTLFEASVSYDGQTWVTEPGALVNAAFTGANAMVGIAVSSQIGDSFGLARFDEFSLGAPTPVPAGAVPLSVSVKDADGNPVNGVWVSLRDSVPGDVAGGRSLVDGTAIIPAVQPGSYTAVTWAPGLESVGREVTVTANTSLSLEGVKPLTSLDLASEALPSTEAGWRLKAPAGLMEDLSAPGASLDGFAAVTVPGDWAQQGFPADRNVYGWYRLAVNLPSELQGKPLLLTNFNVDDSDWTYWDGHLIGTRLSDAGAVRTYSIPASWTQGAGHTLAIRAYNISGGAGMTNAAPQLRLAGAPGSVTGTVTDAAGTPAPWVSVRLQSDGTGTPATNLLTSTGPDGVYGFGGLPTGRYRVTLDRVSTAAPQTVEVTETSPAPVADFAKQGVPSLLLVKENGFEWKVRATRGLTIDDLPDLPNIVKNEVGDYSAVDADEKDFQPFELSGSSLVYTAPEGGDGVFAWFRLHFTLPKAWSEGQRGDLRLWRWQLDDCDRAYFNGTLIGQSGSFIEDPLSWIDAYNAFRDYRIPAEIVNWDGDNVLAIRAFAGGPSVGWSRGTLPVLSATAASGAAAPTGDVDADGSVGIRDVVLALRSLVGMVTLTPAQSAAADVKPDGKVDIQDVLQLLRRVAGLG